MAWSGAEQGQGGYATASAIAVSMALAMIASAVAGLSGAELKDARADLARVRIESDLDAAQALAAIAVLKSDQKTRLRWSLITQNVEVDVLAEPEATKAGYDQAAKLTGAEFARLGVEDMAALRDRLGGAAAEHQASPRELDSSVLWQTCAPSMISRFGQAEALGLVKAETPNTRRFDWRAGDVWRIRVASPDGWSDDRLVRFTGDTLHPAAIIERRFSRAGTADRQCDTLFAQG